MTPLSLATAQARWSRSLPVLDSFGHTFPHDLREAPLHVLREAALLARESGSFTAFQKLVGRSVTEVLSGPRAMPFAPPARAEDDESHAEGARANAYGQRLGRAKEFCERFIPARTVEGGSRDRISLVTLHRLAFDFGLKGCPSLVQFSAAMQQLYPCVGGENGNGLVLTGRKLKP